MSDSKLIAKNTLMLYSRQILTMVVSLYTVRVVLETLGASDYGLYNVVAGVVTMFSFLMGSMAVASQRYFSFDLGKNDIEHLKKTFSLTITIYLIIAVGILILAETFGLWFVHYKLIIPKGREAVCYWVYQFSVISFLFTIMTSPFMADIIAHEDMSIYAYVSILEVSLKLAVVFLIRLFPIDKLWLYGLLMLLVTITNTTVYRTICKIKYEECKFKFCWEKDYAKEMLDFTFWNIFGAATGTFKYQLVNILLNQFFNPIIISARSIASSINSAVNSFSQNFSMALRPQIIKSYAAKKYEESLDLVYRGCKFTFFLMLIFTVPLFFEMDSVLTLWLREPPENAALFTRLALLDALIDSLNYPIMTLAQATGKIRLYQSLVGGVLLCNFPVSWVVLKFGSPAYAVFVVAIVIAVIAMAIRLIIVKMLMSFSIMTYLKEVVIPSFIVTLMSFISSFILYHFTPKNLILCFIRIGMEVFMVCTFAYIFGFKKTERKYVIGLIKSKIFKK